MQVKHISSFLLLASVLGGVVTSSPALAEPTKISQAFRQNLVLKAGEIIEVRLNSNDTLYVSRGERKAAELRVDQPVVSDNGNILISEGAIISGEFIPVSGGSKFVARTLTTQDGMIRIVGETDLINDVKDPRETGIGSLLGDAGIGAAAGALLGGIFGDRSISTEKILGGAAASIILGNVTAPQVVVIDPALPLSIVTKRKLTFRAQSF